MTGYQLKISYFWCFRIRAEKERKVAEAREMKIQLEEELKEKINRKAEDKNVLTEKLMEKRLNEEKGKQKLRLLFKVLNF